MSQAQALHEESSIERIERLSEQNLFACYQCGKCTADCPFSLGPNLVMRLLQLGQLDEARHLVTTWECAACYTCATGCPKGVSPALVMKALRSLDGGRPLSTYVPLMQSRNGTPFAGLRKARALPLAVFVTAFIRKIRSYLLAVMPHAFKAGSRMASVSNFFIKLPGGKILGHLFLGLHRGRPVPLFAKETFPKWFKKHKPLGDGHRGKVAFFHDTFMDYNYPQIGWAAVEILEKAGFTVELTDTVCCGRPAISKGIASMACRSARINVERLFEEADRGIFIVGCEPSCLLSLRDEYPHLVPPELHDKARVVARQTFLIDEFLNRLHEKGELELKFQAPGNSRPLLFHGHCHQKAFAHPLMGVELLERARYDVEFVNAACCGMAGAYGFEKEHYRSSRAAGERALFPAIRSRPDADVVIMGVSCRQQITHFTGRPVRHLVEVLRDSIVDFHAGIR